MSNIIGITFWKYTQIHIGVNNQIVKIQYKKRSTILKYLLKVKQTSKEMASKTAY